MGQNLSIATEKLIIQEELGPLGIDYQYALTGGDSSPYRSPYVCAKISSTVNSLQYTKNGAINDDDDQEEQQNNNESTTSSPIQLLFLKSYNDHHHRRSGNGEDSFLLIKVIPKSFALYEEQHVERNMFTMTTTTTTNNGGDDAVSRKMDQEVFISLLYTISQLYQISPDLVNQMYFNYDLFEQQLSLLEEGECNNVNGEQQEAEHLKTMMLNKKKQNFVLQMLNGCFMPKHANLPALYGVFQSKRAFYLLMDHQNFTLDELLKFNQPILKLDDTKRRFLFYQMIQFVFFCHKSGFAHGKIRPCNILLNDMLWVSIIGQDILYTPKLDDPMFAVTNDGGSGGHVVPDGANATREVDGSSSSSPSSLVVPPLRLNSPSIRNNNDSPAMVSARAPSPTVPASHSNNNNTNYYGSLPSLESISGGTNNTYGSVNRSSVVDDDLVSSVISRWQKREISNYEYLIALNEMAGRRLGDSQFHPILPWVMDFSSPFGEWRDLTKTKYRLNKGDQMLDFTFQSPENPHHVTEPLSEITYFIYMARRTPVELLKLHVRTHYEPREYPLSVVRMYHWTPDECIPELYTDPSVFKSIHPDMSDLELPEWATDANDFIQKHREALESDQVSRQLHHWIDLIFGYKLSGQAAIDAKNVMLKKEHNDLIPTRYGYVQLFNDPHPPRFCSSIQDDANGLELAFYEQTLRFSATYFSTPEYHTIPYLIRAKKCQIEVSQKDLFADDMFALGCLLAELYTFQPLFNSKTLDYYLTNPDMSKYKSVPQFEKIPQPARFIIESLIDLDASKRKKVFQHPQSKRMFPTFFKFAYWFLSKFYTLPTQEEKLSFAMKHVTPNSVEREFFSSGYNPYMNNGGLLVDLPSEGLEITLPHVLQYFFSVKKVITTSGVVDVQHLRSWCDGVKILKKVGKHINRSKLLRCETIRKLVKKKLNELYLESEKMEGRTLPAQDLAILTDLQLNLYSFSFSSFLYDLIMIEEESSSSAQKEFKRMYLEQVLPFFIEAMFTNRNEKITSKARETVHRMSKQYFGTLLTLQHVVEPVISKISRLYINGKKGTYSRGRINENVIQLLNDIGLIPGPSSMLGYYIPKFLRIILEQMKTEKKFGEQSPDQAKLVEDDTSHSANVLIIYKLLETLLHRIGHQSNSTVNSILLNNLQLFVDLMQMYGPSTLHPDSPIDVTDCYFDSEPENSLTIEVFKKYIQLVTYMLQVCEVGVRFQVIQALRGSIRSILHSDVSFKFDHPEESVYDCGYQKSDISLLAPNKVRIDDDEKGKPYQPIRSLVSRIRASVISHKEQQSLLSRRMSTNVPPLYSVKSLMESNDLMNEIVGEQPEITFLPEQSSSELGVGIEASPSPLFATKDDFLKGYLLYAELCRVLGNSLMREAVNNSRVFEDYFTRSIPVQDNSESNNESPVPAQASYPHWFLQNPGTVQRVVTSGVSYDDVRNSEYRVKGILEFEFDDGKIASNSNPSIRCIDMLESDERIFITGGRDRNLPCVKFWNLESDNPHSISTLYPYPSVSSKRDIVKVQFLNPNDGRIMACSDRIIGSPYGNLHIFDTEMNRLLFTIHGGAGPNQNSYFNHMSQRSIDSKVNLRFLLNRSNVPETHNQSIITGVSNLDHRNGQIASFDVLNNNMLVTTTNDCKLKFYDLRASGVRECYEWRIFPPMHQFGRSSIPSVPLSVSACAPQDKHIAVGLSTGVVFLLEKYSGLIIDSFQAHDREISKIAPYKSTPGHLFTCSSAAESNVKSDLIRMWDTHSSVPAKCERAFKLNVSQLQPQSQQDTLISQAHIAVRSFDVCSRTDSDHIFAVTNHSVLHYRNSNFISPPESVDDTMAYNPSFGRNRRPSSQTAPNFHMNLIYNLSSQDTTQSPNPITPVTPSMGASSKFTDVKYFPLHKLLLVTTSDGKIGVFS